MFQVFRKEITETWTTAVIGPIWPPIATFACFFLLLLQHVYEAVLSCMRKYHSMILPLQDDSYRQGLADLISNLNVAILILLPNIMYTLNIMCYIIIINIMSSLNITCNTTSHLLSSSCAIFLMSCPILLLHYLSTLCAIFLIFFLSCAIHPLTIIIIIAVLHFNYAKLFSPSEYLILPIYLYISPIFVYFDCTFVNLLVYFYYSVYFSIVLLYCYATWHKNFLRD